uniref:Uncharacterized protein n=1 Tax=Takifugu rubripes TaxID=31033 RepID=A0A674NXE0_TAKRU
GDTSVFFFSLTHFHFHAHFVSETKYECVCMYIYVCVCVCVSAAISLPEHSWRSDRRRESMANLTVADCFKKKLHEISNIVNFATPHFTVCPPSR